MFHTETRTLVKREKRTLGQATCDRCGHVMDEGDYHSGYDNLTLLRFRAGPGSQFGEGRYVEGDFCDACLFDLLSRYVRVIDADAVPESADFFRVDAPCRLYAQNQIESSMAQGIFLVLGEWIARCFDPSFPRHPVERPAASPRPADGPEPPDAETADPAR